jgi:hypothetical protein
VGDRPRVGKTLFNNQQRVDNNHFLPTNGGSAKRWWVSKIFTSATYNDSRRGSVKVFTDRRRVSKATFTDPPSVINNEPWCSVCLPGGGTLVPLRDPLLDDKGMQGCPS